MVWARVTGLWAWRARCPSPPRTEGTCGLFLCEKVSWAKALGGTDLLGEQPSMLILHRPVLGKHIIKLLDDFRDTQRPREKGRE